MYSLFQGLAHGGAQHQAGGRLSQPVDSHQPQHEDQQAGAAPAGVAVGGDTWLNVSVSTYGYTGGGGASLLIFMMGMVAVNGLAEAATCLVLGTAVCKALEKTVHRNEVRSVA